MIVYIEPTVSTWQGLRVRCDYLLSAPDLFEDRWGQAMQTIDWTDTESVSKHPGAAREMDLHAETQ